MTNNAGAPLINDNSRIVERCKSIGNGIHHFQLLLRRLFWGRGNDFLIRTRNRDSRSDPNGILLGDSTNLYGI